MLTTTNKTKEETGFKKNIVMACS